jgi:hypothetical protein
MFHGGDYNMNNNRQSQIINRLFDFQGGRITEDQLNSICRDRAEKHFAISKLRRLNIYLCYDYRTLAYGEQAVDTFRRRKDLERELTIKRKQERQHKTLLRSI